MIALFLNAVLAFAEALTLQPSDSGEFRFKDILGQKYSAAFIAAYSYSSANVQISLNSDALPYLSGMITATGLKPNFAYQIKLIGRPTNLVGADGDDATNERLGYLGRWWRAQPSPGNSTDADYNAHKNDSAYIFQGYLLLAFFVTDEHGCAHVPFIGNNSYHVLWRADQRARDVYDGPPLSVTLPPTTSNAAYDVALPERAATLYGEYEPTRALPGALEMPAERYKCAFLLTEESFHDSSESGGKWAHALIADCEFNIPTTATTPSESLPLDILQLRARLNLCRNGYDRASILGRLTLLEGATLNSIEVNVHIMGMERIFVLDQRGHAFSDDGRLLVWRDRQDKNKAIFLLNLRRGEFASLKSTRDISHSTPSATTCVAVRLRFGAQTYASTIETARRTSKRFLILKN